MRIEDVMESLPPRTILADQEMILRAYKLAEEVHRKQKRASGEPYINHCLAVAALLVELHMPAAVIAAGLLHDTVEDTETTIEDIKQDFGEEVSRLVDGVTKLTQLPRVSRNKHLVNERDLDTKSQNGHSGSGKPGRTGGETATQTLRSSKEELASETLRKTFLAMGEDVRVVMIKLADRLHNIRTIGYLSEEKQQRIAKETLNIFAPLASRLGIWQMKWELEDLSFRYVNPEKYKEIAGHLAERRSERESKLESIVKKLKELLAQNGIQGSISGRPKHIYSIFRKMQRKEIPIEMVQDIRGVRILVPDISNCYTVLGLIHTHWPPIPGEFDDYIASPKDNFYQSLHTAVIYDDGRNLEVQIRTQEMHQNAEYGIAAHWRYKEGASRDETYERRIVWLRQLMEWMQDVDDATEFVDNMQTDVFSDRVYAFTPDGDIIDLPAGSTPLDFAYHVHTEIGHRCRGAKVNGKLEPLEYILKTGDQVEIRTSKRGGPSRDWLNPNLRLINTNKARAHVRRWFRQLDRAQNIAMGKQQLDRELRRLSLQDVDLKDLAEGFNYHAIEELYLAIGTGDLAPARIINRLTLEEKELQDVDYLRPPDVEQVQARGDSIQVQGLKGLLTSMGKCCNPVPGDNIIGYVTRGRGATIHRYDCPNVLRIKDKERLVQVSWGEHKTTYPVAVRIKAYDRDGLMRDVSTLITEEGISMSEVKVTVKKSVALFDLIMEVGDIGQLNRVLTRVETLPNVVEARRVRPG